LEPAAPEKAMTDLSVIIITHNSRQLLEPCIMSVRRSVESHTYEIIVVENGSNDGSLEWLLSQEDIKTIANENNRGVAPARNQGLRQAAGKYLLILDVDTRVEPRAFDVLVECMDGNPGVGLGAPKLVDGSGNLQYTCRYYPTVLTKIYRRLHFDYFKRKLEEEILADWPHDSERDIDYVIGACQVFRREAFERVGLLDEHIFYGPEDIDYCVRMWAAGWRVRYFPQSVVRHLERRITTRLFSPMTIRHAWGLAHFFWKYRYVLRNDRMPGCRNYERKSPGPASGCE